MLPLSYRFWNCPPFVTPQPISSPTTWNMTVNNQKWPKMKILTSEIIIHSSSSYTSSVIHADIVFNTIFHISELIHIYLFLYFFAHRNDCIHSNDDCAKCCPVMLFMFFCTVICPVLTYLVLCGFFSLSTVYKAGKSSLYGQKLRDAWP